VLDDVPDNCTVGGLPARTLVRGGWRVTLLDRGGDVAHALTDLAERVPRLEGVEPKTVTERSPE
jgi:hypothetical protein